MKNQKFHIQVLTISVLVLMATAPFLNIAQAHDSVSVTSDPQREQIIVEQNLDHIVIFYDPTRENMSSVVNSVDEILSYRLYNVYKIPITTQKKLIHELQKNPWIAIYGFNSNLTGIMVGEDFLSWQSFYDIVRPFLDTEHVIGTANTLSLDAQIQQLPPHIHLSESGQTDLKILTMYNLWAVAELAKKRASKEPEYNQTANDLRAIALQLYSDNFNALFTAQMDPTEPIGQVDEVAREKRTQAMWDRHEPHLQPTMYRELENGSLIEIPQTDDPYGSENSSTFNPIIQTSPRSAAEASGDFILGDLPLFSGLNGPIGEIVDILLNVLAGVGETTLSIPSDVMDTIKESFYQIQDVVGIVQDFNAESPLKGILNALGNEFPFLDELKPFLEIFSKALFNFRGDLPSIQTVITDLITAIFDQGIPAKFGGIIEDVLGVGADLWDSIEEVVSSGKSVFAGMMEFFSTNVLDKLLNKTLVSTLGLNINEALNISQRFIPFIQELIGFLGTYDLENLIIAIKGPILENIIGPLSTAMQEGMNKVTSLIEVVFSASELVENFDLDSVLSLVQQMMNEIIGPSDIVGDIDTFTRELMDVVKHYKEIASTNINNFRIEIESILQARLESSVSAEIRQVVEDVMVLIAGIYNEGFTQPNIPDIFSIIEVILQESGLDPTELTDLLAIEEHVLQPFLGLIGQFTDSELFQLTLPSELTDFDSFLTAMPEFLNEIITYLDFENVLSVIPDVDNILATFGDISAGIINIIHLAKDQSFTGVLQSIWMSVGSIIGIHPSFENVPIGSLLSLFQSFFPEAYGLEIENLPSIPDTINEILGFAQDNLIGTIDIPDLREFLNIAMELKGLFTNGLDWMVGKMLDWLQGLLDPVITQLENTIGSVLGAAEDLVGFAGTLPIGLGEWSLFELSLDLALTANFNLNADPLFDMIRSLILDARSTFSLESIGDFFQTTFSFFEISPLFKAEMGVAGLDSSKNSFMQYLLTALGLDLSFSGSAKFVLNLFTFRGGVFEWENFFKVIEWMFHIELELSKTFTLLEFLTGGVGGGVLTKISEFLGLDAITVTIFFGVVIDIVKKAATATAQEVSTLSLTLTLGALIHIGIDLAIVAISLDGGLEIILTFFQDLAKSAPMQITLRLILTFKVKLRFLFASLNRSWEWEPGGPWDLSPNPGDAEFDDAGVGFDSDGDGLGDSYEEKIPGLSKDKSDSDNDGASDKLEVKSMGTDASDPDSDGDGLLDGEEWELGTSPHRPDSDWDKISDYEEINTYNTNPLSPDTDGDGLSDYFEITTALNISLVTTTVDQVTIGGKTYNDHTDPLNPDTDGDGLVDGDEGPTGAFYGEDYLYNESLSDGNPVIFNNGYTHPLDADTDDDSYLQLYDGTIDSQALTFLKDMNDGAEVAGFRILVYDEAGEPEYKRVFTNPVNPDTDGDTGVTDRTPQPGAWLNSDGFELAQTPPSDPTNGDSDYDGLLDGLEGVLKEDSNHTNVNDPDTDDDGLYDMQELLLGTDPRTADTDFDMIPDGQEFYTFFTNPKLFDSDFDGLGDGEEVFTWHSNPLSDDSDNDGLMDGREVLKWGSDPMDEDGDNDGLSDFIEIKVYYTNPFAYDSDEDGLSDGEEVLYYKTDPLNWDTDGDSIEEPNEMGEMTWSMSDYDEVRIYGTNATDPDSDMDGLSDALELYIGADIIPWLEPYELDPMNPDTDGDGFKDGSELRVQNVSDIIFPYVSQTLLLKYNTSPVLLDTDGDNITDFDEVVIYNSNPQNIDSDNDTLTDWEEIVVFNTSAIYNDTDGDGLLDNEEIYGYGNMSIPAGAAPKTAQSPPIYETDPLDPDTDDDWLPDGSEILRYGTNPTIIDSDGDDIPDTEEFDSDLDGLEDGHEYRLGLQVIPNGGILNPDSDGDGLSDGQEVYEYNTDPQSSDTDGDGYGDGTEVFVGTDPTESTSTEEFNTQQSIKQSETAYDLIMPVDQSLIYFTSPVRVINYTNLETVYFRYKMTNQTTWSTNLTLTYNEDVQQWIYEDIEWTPGEYELELFAKDLMGEFYYQKITFEAFKTPPDETGQNWLYYAGAGGGGLLLGVGAILIISLIKNKKGGS